MKKVLYLSLIGILTVLSTPCNIHAQAGSDRPTLQSEERLRKLPFYGRLNAHDAEAGTVTVGKRVFQVTSETKITQDEKPVTLGKEMIGHRVGGSYVKEPNGALRALSLRILPEAGPEKDSPREEGKASSP